MFIAFFIGYQAAGPKNTDAVVTMGEIKTNTRFREELFDVMAKSVEKNRGPASTNKTLPSAYEQKLLAVIDAADPLQKGIADMLMAGRAGKDDPEAVARLKEKFRANPQAGFRAQKQLLEKLPYQDFPVEKAAVMAFTAELSLGSSEEIRDLTSSTLTNDIAPARMTPEQAKSEAEMDQAYSGNEQLFLPAISYGTYLKNSQDPQLVLTDTVKFLEAQQDYAVRNNIVDSFTERYPKLEKELQQLVSESKIDVQVLKHKEAAAQVAVEEEKLRAEYQAKIQQEGKTE